MFDEIENTAADRLPIFPLPLILMPGEILPLHIFEEKYRQMLSDIGGEGGRFGIVAVFESDDAGTEDLVGRVGTVAEIHDLDQLDDGRANIIVLGSDRFRVAELFEYEKPYLLGDLEILSDEIDTSDETQNAADEVFDLFKRMTAALFKMSGSRGKMPQPAQTEPEPLSFLIATAFDLSLDRKYELISLLSTRERLNILLDILRESTDKIEQNADLTQAAKTNGHSKKKLDL